MTLTREETIERLKQNKAAAEYYAGQSRITAEIENSLKDSEAFDMAIEALSADTVAIIQTGQTYGKSAYIKEFAEVVRCKDCKYKRLYDEGETKYYYCALEDRPNRNWSIDDTDYCSWGENSEAEE